jgi:protein-S-isoprenylcysteine O-methyltransferase Ste14
MIYVTIQFACIIWLLLQVDMQQVNALHIVLLFVVAAIGAWAVISMRLDNINIVPALKDNHRLVTTGIYRYIRHPMYACVLLFSAVLLGTSFNWINSAVFGILLVDLWLKLRHEERLLSERFPEYRDYQKKTKMIIPYIH